MHSPTVDVFECGAPRREELIQRIAKNDIHMLSLLAVLGNLRRRDPIAISGEVEPAAWAQPNVPVDWLDFQDSSYTNSNRYPEFHNNELAFVTMPSSFSILGWVGLS